MAEGILRYKTEAKGMNVKIDSAGIESLHVGESPDSRAVKTASKYGVDISKLVARQITVTDFDRFDWILVAEAQVYNEVIALAQNENDKKKVKFIMDYLYPGRNTAVPDPYYGGIDGFEKVFDMLDKTCDALITEFSKP